MVTFRVPGWAKGIQGAVAINDGANGWDGSKTPLTFSVVQEGKSLWQSRPHQRCIDPEEFQVPLSPGIVELRVECPGDAYCAHAVWVDPRFEEG